MTELIKESLKESEEDTYIDLCRTIGPLTDYVQSTGGNISVKNKDLDLLLIKTSGTRLINCDYQTYSLKMIKSIVEKNEKLPMSASIETYFHTFDSKFIVHLHPGPALDFLTKYESSSFTISFEEIDPISSFKGIVYQTYNIIDYVKPGFDLYESLIPYKNEKVVLMKNHGVLIMDESIENIIKHMKNIELAIFTKCLKCSDIMFVYTFRNMLKNRFKHKVDLILKPFLLGLNGKCFNEKYFLPFTPDHSVFLTKAPLMFESKSECWNEKYISDELDKHLTIFKEFPTIICVNGLLYTCSKTFDGCLGLEEMLYSYFCVSGFSNNKSETKSESKHLSEIEVNKLKSWSSELERRKKLGLDLCLDSSSNKITHM